MKLDALGRPTTKDCRDCGAELGRTAQHCHVCGAEYVGREMQRKTRAAPPVAAVDEFDCQMQPDGGLKLLFGGEVMATLLPRHVQIVAIELALGP